MMRRNLIRSFVTILLAALLAGSQLLFVPPVSAADYTATLNVDTTSTTAFNTGFSGFNVITSNSGVDYKDQDFINKTAELKPGWLRFVAGGAANTFNIKSGDQEEEWNAQFYKREGKYDSFNGYSQVIEGKGYQKLIDYKNLLDQTGAKLIIDVNVFTDSPENVADLVNFCNNNHIQVEYWQLGNEPYFYTKEDKDEYPYMFETGTDYLNKAKAFHDAIKGADPNAKTMIMQSEGGDKYPQFDNDIANYSNQYWDAVSYHSYEGGGDSTDQASMESLNESLNTIYNEVTNDIVSKNRANIPVVITEFNTTLSAVDPATNLRNTLYNGIYAAEFMLRLSTHPNMKHVGLHALTASGVIGTSDDHEQDAINAWEHGTTVDTTGMNFGYYDGAVGLALEVANHAINNSRSFYHTSISGTQTVNRTNGTMDALFAKTYKGDDGNFQMVVVNKSNKTYNLNVQMDGTNVTGSLDLEWVANTDFKIKNSTSNPTALSIQSGQSSNPVFVPAYSVMRIQWANPNNAAPVTPVLNQATADSQSSITLNWKGSPTADSYNVKYSTTSGGPYTVLNVGNVTSYQVTGLAQGTVYYFTVSAQNTTGGSANSNEIDAKTGVPAAPVLTQAYGKKQSVSLEWNGWRFGTGYKIVYGTTSGSYPNEIDVGNVLGYTVTGLTGSTPYYFAVKAYNDIGTSPASNELSAVPKGLKPFAPNSVELTKTSTSATLSWKRSPIPTLLSDFESTPDWTVHTGTWSVQTDDGSQAYVSSNNSGIQLATANSGPWDDYDVDADIRVDSVTGFVGKFGVVGRFQNTNNYYSFVYDPVNEVFKLRKKVGGTLTTIATGTVGVGDWMGSYNRMRLSMISHNLKGYYDGNLVISATDSSLTSGSAGIITEAGQVAFFDRYIVRAPNDDHYILQRSLSPYSGYTTIASNITGTTYTDSGLDPSKTYYYRLQSVNSFSIKSNYYSSPVTKSGS
ncbi:MAG: hypothetical protein K0R75_3733 [Paenibacillaceae bacterium]|jgi:fibronectin type 3 domain-containing protein|nr:hypothetical protein [Paenibacillaceae bacterium]